MRSDKRQTTALKMLFARAHVYTRFLREMLIFEDKEKCSELFFETRSSATDHYCSQWLQ